MRLRMVKVHTGMVSKTVLWKSDRFIQTCQPGLDPPLNMVTTLSLREEEKLSEVASSFPVLYDKSQKGCEEKDAVRNVLLKPTIFFARSLSRYLLASAQ